MSFLFGTRSYGNLYGNGVLKHMVHPFLQELCLRTIRKCPVDFTIIQGWRSDEAQNEAYEAGNSKLKGGRSNHNKTPSRAVDFSPYPIDFTDIPKYLVIVNEFKKEAVLMGLPIICGADWVMRDYGHIELPNNAEISLEMV